MPTIMAVTTPTMGEKVIAIIGPTSVKVPNSEKNIKIKRKVTTAPPRKPPIAYPSPVRILEVDKTL
jgi:hypothetical protein